MSKSKFLLMIIFIAAFMPVNALAWGPGVHISIGLSILDNLNLVFSMVQEVILKYPYYFLYGCISPDVLIGKGNKIERVPSHRWDTAFSLLKNSDLRAKAYGFGYMTHLAADTISHNYFIPNMLQLFNFNRGKISHVLTESYVDRNLNLDKSIIKELMNNKNLREMDRLFIKTIKYKSSLFKIKRILFKKGIIINFIPKKEDISFNNIKKKILDSWHYVEDMIDLSKKSAIDIINKQKMSQLIDYDPMGFRNLYLAKQSNKLGFKTRYRGVVPFFIPSISLLNL